jgi:transcriptional antiterminator RfaH
MIFPTHYATLGTIVLQQWYVATTKVGREAATAAVLTQRDIEVYLPTAPPPRRAARRPTSGEALFPGYLFARLDLESNAWLRARSAPGIAYFLGSGDSPSALPDDLIHTIRQRAERGRSTQWRPPFEAGEAVIIKAGPFAGVEAVFDACLTGRGRVRVLLELVQRLVPVDLDVEQLAKAG